MATVLKAHGLLYCRTILNQGKKQTLNRKNISQERRLFLSFYGSQNRQKFPATRNYYEKSAKGRILEALPAGIIDSCG